MDEKTVTFLIVNARNKNFTYPEGITVDSWISFSEVRLQHISLQFTKAKEYLSSKVVIHCLFYFLNNPGWKNTIKRVAYFSTDAFNVNMLCINLQERHINPNPGSIIYVSNKQI